jgi:hypothetical protein
MSWGNKPTDGGHFILSPEEREALLAVEPAATRFVRRYMSGGDFINGDERYCLWLVDASPQDLKALPEVMKRVDAVRRSRLESKAASTREYAKFPTRFRQIAQPESDYLAIPEVSSERRAYIPIAFLSRDVICSNTVQFVPDATLFHFGILSSGMHMAWVRSVCGRMKSDYRYSNSIVYNNFPWPEPSDKQRVAIEAAAKHVLDARAAHPDATLADLYDPLTMPPDLLRAHQTLDRAVDAAYAYKDAPTDAARVAFLFARYQALTSLLPAQTAKPRRGGKTKP